MLEKGGVIFQKGKGYIEDGCKDFNQLWDVALENERKLDMLIAHLGLEVVTGMRIEKKETPNTENAGLEATYAKSLRALVFEGAREDHTPPRTKCMALMDALEPIISEIARLKAIAHTHDSNAEVNGVPLAARPSEAV